MRQEEPKGRSRELTGRTLQRRQGVDSTGERGKLLLDFLSEERQIWLVVNRVILIFVLREK